MALVIPNPDGINKAKAIFLGRSFGIAFCEHFGLPANKVTKVTPHADRDEIMHAKVEIALTPDDLAAIAARMGAAGVSLDRLPVVSMGVDMASGPDMTAKAAVSPDGEIATINRCADPFEVIREQVQSIADWFKVPPERRPESPNHRSAADPMEAVRAMSKGNGGGSSC